MAFKFKAGDCLIQVAFRTGLTVHYFNTDRQARAKCVDPDEMLHNAASHLGLHCLPPIQQFIDKALCSKLYLFKF